MKMRGALLLVGVAFGANAAERGEMVQTDTLGMNLVSYDKNDEKKKKVIMRKAYVGVYKII